MTDLDPSNRTDLPAAFDERATHPVPAVRRLTVHAKCVDLSPSDAAETPLPGSPAMSVAGLVSHLRWSEAFWIDVIFLGQRYHWPGTDDDSELQMRAGLERPLADLLDEYAAQAAHTDDVIASHDWDAEVTRRPTERQAGHVAVHRHAPDRGDRRHNGHLDILRELADDYGG